MTPATLFATLRPHRVRRRLLIFAVLLIALLGVRLERLIESYEGAQPIVVSFRGLTAPEAAAVQVTAVSARGYVLPLERTTATADSPAVAPGDVSYHLTYRFWARNLRLYLPSRVLARPVALHIEIGDSCALDTDTRALAATWTRIPITDSMSHLTAWESPPTVRATCAPLSPFRALINGPEDGLLAAFVLPSLAILAVSFPALFLLSNALKPRTKAVAALRVCLDSLSSSSPTRTRVGEDRDLLFFLLGAVAFALSLLALTHGQRYAFVQDDNMSQFFPTILQGCRSLESGIFSTLNPYQLMGSPTASLGVYALTYPMTYLSYVVAAHVFGDPYLTLDLFVIAHLAAGYVFTYVLGRRIGLRPSLAMTASLSFVLCGYLAVYTRGWFYMAPVATWTPLLLLQILRLTDTTRPVRVGWAIGTGLAIGAFFHAGNAQMWVYALLLGGALLAFLAYGRRVPRQNLVWAACALLIGLAVAAPLLVAQSAEVAGIDRGADYRHGLLPGLGAMLLPAPLTDAAHPGIEPGVEAIWPQLYHFAPLYYCGPVFLGIGLLALLSLPFVRWGRRLVGANAFLLCGGLALWFGAGEDGGLAQIAALLPAFNKFQHNWKFLPFVALFFALGGGLIVERLLRRRAAQSAMKGTSVVGVCRIEFGLAGTLTALLAWNSFLSQPVLHFGDRPYPTLPAAMRATLFKPVERPQRAMTVAPWYRLEPGFVFSLAQNFSTMYQMPVLEGYDPLVEATDLNTTVRESVYPSPLVSQPTLHFHADPSNDPLRALRAYGVRWVLVTNGTLGAGKRQLLGSLAGRVTARLATVETVVYELPGSDPLAFLAANPAQALPIEYDTQGATVAVRQVGGQEVVVNLLARPRMRAYADGLPVPIRADAWNRIVVHIPAGATTLRVRYEPDWKKGFAVGAVLLVAAMGLAGWAHIGDCPPPC